MLDPQFWAVVGPLSFVGLLLVISGLAVLLAVSARWGASW